jgi:hypothetical protein
MLGTVGMGKFLLLLVTAGNVGVYTHSINIAVGIIAAGLFLDAIVNDK